MNRVISRTSALSLLIIMLAPLGANAETKAAPSGKNHALSADYYLAPRLQAGQVLGDVVSRTIATHGEGKDDFVWRSSGTGVYTILPGSNDAVTKWDSDVVMEGILTEKASGEFRDGGRTSCYKGKCSVSTSASALIYNPTFWGDVKGDLTVGKSWTVELAQPWENGPSGHQTVTVVAVDPTNGIVILKREGTGEGRYDGDRKQTVIKRDGKPFTVDVTPGPSHWVGQSVFKKGIVVSDELVSDRTITYTSPEVGTIHGQERQYMTLTLLPQ
jgi:hypothetical protein